jgi:hypothetical protein
MHMPLPKSGLYFRQLTNKVFRLLTLTLILSSQLLALSFSFLQEKATAANFSMQTGQYVGSGAASRTVTGVGFQPDTVLIKSASTAGVAVFKTSAMPASNTAYMSATANNTATQLSFTADGFTLGTLANLNSVNTIYYWTAFTGSDCSASGNYCVGAYTGNGVATRTIDTGFQPSIVINKRSTAVAGHFRTASMAANRTEFFTTTTADTAGSYLRSFSASGFEVGSTQDNVNAGLYYFIAFKSGSGAVAEGTYTGNGVDNRNITGVGFQPEFVYTKNSTSATTNNRRSVMTTSEGFGDLASYVGDAIASGANLLQALQVDGFQLGSGVNTNENTATFYWFALAGTSTLPAASGTFTMDQGTYTGTGAIQSITGLSFAPDLVLIKDNGANYAVFRTKDMGGDITAHMVSATADFAGGITALTSNGFNLGISTITNTSGNTYHWQAFGNAYKADRGGGAADFAIGTHYGNGIDNSNISLLPWQPDFITLKRNSTSNAVFRTSAQAGDLSALFTASADTSNLVQNLNSTGYQVGTSANVNTAGSNYRWFAFKEGANFDVGNYTGTGVDNLSVTSPGFSPNNLWIKRNSTSVPVQRASTLTGDNTQNFSNVANFAGRVKSFSVNGFSLGTQAEVNTNGSVYRYVAWRNPDAGSLSTDVVDGSGVPVASPNFIMNNLSYPFSCSASTGTLGTSSQKIRTTNTTSNGAWSVSIAATNGSTELWRNGGNTQQIDYNDSGGSPAGCSDGGDADVRAGQLSLEPSGATLTPAPGCSSTNVNLGSNQAYIQGTVDSITLLSASSGSDLDCYWDLIGVNLIQYVPAEQQIDSYDINLTITTIAL